MSKSIKVLNFSTHDENCGIGKYQEMFLDELKDSEVVESNFFVTSPNQLRGMSDKEKQVVYRNLRDELKKFDILHIQHEFSFLHSLDFPRIAHIAKELGKKLVITIHTSPTLAYERPALSSFAPRSILHYSRQLRRKLIFNKIFTSAVLLADILIVHNTNTKNALIELGVSGEKIKQLVLPVPQINKLIKSTLISEKLNKQPQDIILATTGFLHKYKGIDHAVRALTYLPSNYKLAIIGGMHIDHNPKVYNDITNLIHELDLKDRVYITGFIEDDAMLNALVRECDICVYPYDKTYYSNISSASLNNGFANHKPVIAYPTTSFIELNEKVDAMILPGAFAYYELAREVERIDLEAASEKSKQFSVKYSYSIIANDLIEIYKLLI